MSWGAGVGTIYQETQLVLGVDAVWTTGVGNKQRLVWKSSEGAAGGDV